jgi:hypothetical protein
MSNISLIYDGLVSAIQAELTDYEQLPDAYDIGGNDDIRMISGFSVGFGASINTKRLICNKISIERTFNLRFTKLRAATEDDVTGRATEEKALMDDAFSIYDLLRTTNVLNGIQVVIDYESDGGIEFSEDGQHLIINAAISAEYFE